MVHGWSCPTAGGYIPGPGIEPMSPALQDRLSTAGPQGKPQIPGI